MEILAFSGGIGEGKSTLIDAILKAEPSAQANESSLLIAKVANRMNRLLGSRYDVVFSGSDASICSWINASLVPALQQEIKVPFDDTNLDFSFGGSGEARARDAKLREYLKTVALNPLVIDTRIQAENKEDYRPLLQWIGGFVTLQTGEGLWYKELIRQAKVAETEGCTAYLLGGVRFPVDAEVCRNAGATLIGVSRPGLQQVDSADYTESHRSLFTVDTTVINNGTIEQLGRVGPVLLQDIRRDNLQAEYQAVAF